MTFVQLDDPLLVLRGVGTKIAAALEARGLRCVEDILYLLPRTYRDRRQLVAPSQLVDGQAATTWGTVLSCRRRGPPRRRRLEVELGEGPGQAARLRCVWFRGHQGLDLELGERVIVGGVPRLHEGLLQLAHPYLSRGETAPGIEPVYPVIEQVAPALLRRFCAQAVQQVEPLPELLSAELAAELELPTLRGALATLHRLPGTPEPERSVDELLDDHPARRRVALEELFGLQLALGLERDRWRRRPAWPCALPAAAAEALAATLPFALTSGQRAAADELLEGCAGDRPLRCLLCGDVGSGKTVVFAHALLAAVAAGRQAVVLTPTEVLAQQDQQRLEALLGALGVELRLLTATTAPAEREALVRRLSDGAPMVVVGTHALFGLPLPTLGVVVIDEQQRFGVEQRAELSSRPGAHAPHLVVVSATPIPRTLALAAYGDLDLVVLAGLPPGRQPPRTDWLPVSRLHASDVARARLSEELQRGGRVFVVCPRIASDKGDVQAEAAGSAALSTAKQLEQLHPGQVGLLHGRLDATAREAALRAFRDGERPVLVATTMVEVGLDVPRAALMIVEEAERFGLAQLHQLRGRVGRGSDISRCLLLSVAPVESLAGRRLSLLVAARDGFAIAEADLALRGPGELLGERQAGWARLRVAEPVRTPALLELARHLAQRQLVADPGLRSAPALRGELTRRWGAKASGGAKALGGAEASGEQRP